MESDFSDFKIGGVAQSVERKVEALGVTGSIPVPSTREQRRLADKIARSLKYNTRKSAKEIEEWVDGLVKDLAKFND